MYCIAFAYGMFSVLLLDVLDHITFRMKVVEFLCPLKKEIIICRDRYGVKPCYIFSNSQRIIFSSEIKVK